MLACVDAYYWADAFQSACVSFRDWHDDTPMAETVERGPMDAAYEAGALYRRELPAILAVLKRMEAPLEAIVVDAYVTLSSSGRPGLGAHLHQALGGNVAVIGVAKSAFRGATHAIEVCRGSSARPLFVTSAGIAPEVAANLIRSMHGEHRMPTLLKLVDRLSRAAK